jgi:hypothetical protein
MKRGGTDRKIATAVCEARRENLFRHQCTRTA